MTGATNFWCSACVRRSNGQQRNSIVDHSTTLKNLTIEEVMSFCYLGDMFGAEGGAEKTIKMRAAAAWAMWKEIAELLGMRGVSLKKRAAVFDACIRSVLLYASET